MKVIDLDQYSNCGGCSAMSSFEGKWDNKNADHVKEFQEFANKSGAKPSLDVDGKWGTKTQASWDKYGKKFKEENKAKKSLPAPVVPVVDATDKKEKVKEVVNKGLGFLSMFSVPETDASGKEVIDSVTGQPKTKMNLPLVIGVSVGGLAIVGTIIYFATRKK